jgi:hypothetical protein
MNWIIVKKIGFCLSIGLIGLFPAYRTVGITAPPNWSLFIYFAVYTFIMVEAIAANRGERSRVMLALTLLCGLTYYIGLLFQPTPEGISPASVISAGFVVSSAALALYKGGKVEVLAIGSRRRLFLITLPSWILAECIALWFFPYQTTSPILGIAGIALGIVPLLLVYVPFALYGWGSLRPENHWLRIPPFLGAVIMLYFYTGYDVEHYRLSVMLNLFILFGNGLNLFADWFQGIDKIHNIVENSDR